MPEKNQPGWYGKLPGTGDFLQRHLPEAVVASWSNWFQLGLAHWHHYSENVSAEFIHAPIWNFAIPATLGVQQVQIGCLVPSRDRVGRAWPLLVVQRIALTRWHPAHLAICGDWFRQLGATMYQAVTLPLTAEQLDQVLTNLPSLAIPNESHSGIMDITGYRNMPSTLAWPEVAAHFDPGGYTSYWWTNQSDGYPLASHKHSGNLTAQLFSQLFNPAAVAQPGRHGLYPPMFE